MRRTVSEIRTGCFEARLLSRPCLACVPARNCGPRWLRPLLHLGGRPPSSRAVFSRGCLEGGDPRRCVCALWCSCARICSNVTVGQCAIVALAQPHREPPPPTGSVRNGLEPRATGQLNSPGWLSSHLSLPSWPFRSLSRRGPSFIAVVPPFFHTYLIISLPLPAFSTYYGRPPPVLSEDCSHILNRKIGLTDLN